MSIEFPSKMPPIPPEGFPANTIKFNMPGPDITNSFYDTTKTPQAKAEAKMTAPGVEERLPTLHVPKQTLDALIEESQKTSDNTDSREKI